MKEEEIIKKFKEEISNFPFPDLSKEDQYREFSEELSERTSSKIKALDRFQLRSLARAYTKVFG